MTHTRIIGLALAGILTGLRAAGTPDLVAAAVTVAVAGLLTRGLHLDGLADTADFDATRALLQILRGRRSRRMGLGMQMQSGPLAYRSPHPPMRLTEEEEAILAFAACGVTDGTIIKGVRFFGSGKRTQALIMTTETHHVRFIDTVHVEGGPDTVVRF